MSGELVNYDLTQYLDKNLLLPKIISGPNVYITQRTADFSISSLGSQTDTIKIPSFNGWLKNMFLRVELNALTDLDTNNQKTGYHNWVDNLGHALIEYIQLKVGNYTLFDSSFPYGLWLDIYNELNDPDMLEWSLIGKHSSIDGLKKYETGKRIVYIPLHLWFSQNINNMLPYFLFTSDDNALSISIKTRTLNELVLKSASQTNNNVTIDMKLIYETVEPTDDTNTIDFFKNLYTKIPYQIYTDIPYNVSKPVTSNTNLDFSDEVPIKKIIFVIQNNNRKTLDSTPLINENYSDTNGNDWFNYGNSVIITDTNTTDTFNKLLIKLNNKSKDPIDLELDALYYRKLTNLLYNNNLPQKHIYTIPFSYDYRPNSVLGYYNYNTDTSIQLQFTEPAGNSTINAFAIASNKIEIYNGRVNINTWMENIDINSQQASQTISEQKEETKDNVVELLVSAIKGAKKIKEKKELYKVCRNIQTQNSAIKIKAMNQNKLFLLLNVIKNQSFYDFFVLLPINSSNDFENEDYIKYIKTLQENGKYLVFDEYDNTKLIKINSEKVTTINNREKYKNMIKLIIKLLVLDKKYILGDYLDNLIKYYIDKTNISTTESPQTTSTGDKKIDDFSVLTACPEDLVEKNIPTDSKNKEELEELVENNKIIKGRREKVYEALDSKINKLVDKYFDKIKNRIFKITVTKDQLHDLWTSNTTSSGSVLDVLMESNIHDEKYTCKPAIKSQTNFNQIFLTNSLVEYLNNTEDSSKLINIPCTLTNNFSYSRYLYIDNKKNIYENSNQIYIGFNEKKINEFNPKEQIQIPIDHDNLSTPINLNEDNVYYLPNIISNLKTIYKNEYSEYTNKIQRRIDDNTITIGVDGRGISLWENILDKLKKNIIELKNYIQNIKIKKNNNDINQNIKDLLKKIQNSEIQITNIITIENNIDTEITEIIYELTTLEQENSLKQLETKKYESSNNSNNLILAIEIKNKKVIVHTSNV